MDVKGTELLQLSKFVKHKAGEDGYERWLRSLPEETRTHFTRTIMQSMWYPIETAFFEPIERMLDLVAPDDRIGGAHEAGRFSSREELSGIYKVFLKVGSPNKMVSIASLLWGKFFNKGDLKVLENDPGHARFRSVDVPIEFEPWEHFTAGWAEMALELSGGREATVAVERSTARGDGFTQFLCSWK